MIVQTLAMTFALSSAPMATATAQTAIQASEELRIDAEENNLAPIWWLWVSPKGVMVASQQSDRHFRFFDPNGKPLGTFGRKGDGPGEFQRIEGTRAGWMGDTLWLTEATKPRLTIVGPDLKFVRVEKTPSDLLGPQGEVIKDAPVSPPSVMGVAPDRSLQMFSYVRTGRGVPTWLSSADSGSVFFVRQGRDGRFLRFLVAIGKESDTCLFGDERAQIQIPYCPHRSYTEPLDRNRIVVASPGTSTGTEGSFRLVTVNATTGDTLLKREYHYRPTPIPTLVEDSIRKKITSNAGYPPALKALYQKVSFPKQFPPFRSVLTGRDGTIALEIYTTGGGKAWRFLSARGDDLGIVVFPPSVRLFAVEKGRAWGTDGEEGDQDSIVRYRFP